MKITGSLKGIMNCGRNLIYESFEYTPLLTDKQAKINILIIISVLTKDGKCYIEMRRCIGIMKYAFTK